LKEQKAFISVLRVFPRRQKEKERGRVRSKKKKKNEKSRGKRNQKGEKSLRFEAQNLDQKINKKY